MVAVWAACFWQCRRKVKGHRLYFVADFPAERAAPFFDGVQDVFWFCEDEDRKFTNQTFNNDANKAMLRRLFASVKKHGAINPINLERREHDGEIQDICIHGGGRLWAARRLGISVPAIIDVIDGEPPEDGVEVGDNWRELYDSPHELWSVGNSVRFRQIHNKDQFPQ